MAIAGTDNCHFYNALPSGLFHGLEAHVEAFDRVGQRADGNEVHSTFAVVAESVEGDASGRFDFGLSVDEFNRLACALGSEVVEHDAVNIFSESLTDFVLVAHFHLDFEVLALSGTVFARGLHCLFDTPCEIDMVVLDENHVEEADTVVAASADAHCFFFEHTHAGSGLAGVEHLGLETFETLLVFRGLSGDAAHALHDVEHHAFCLQEGAHRALDLKGYVAGFHMGAVVDIDRHLQFRVEFLKYFAGNLDSGKYSFLLDNETLHSTLVGGNGAQGGVVAVAYVLCKRERQKVVDKFIFSFHIRYQFVSVIFMKIVVIAVGKTSTDYISRGVDEFLKRANRYLSVELTVIPDIKASKALTEETQKQQEGRNILASLQPGDIVTLLDERGKELTSREFSGMIERRMIQGTKRLVFVIGGPYGFSKEVYERADSKLSLSRMTFTHEMVRLFFVEQIYRAMTIMRGEPYHHD